MVEIDAHPIQRQRPCCGSKLEQAIGPLEAEWPTVRAGCNVSIDIDTARAIPDAQSLLHAAVLPAANEVTMKLFR